ncbi:hypothetical protein IWQ56_000612 [Coemansia nantahalensis]|nr:hypothetical protein IWQ56_000612 [Coemansia nantahalensis]
MAGHYAPFSLDGADISPERTDPSAIAYLETFRSGVAKFFGEPDKDGRSARNWVEEVMGFRRECLAALPNQAFAAAIRSKLDGRALHERIETGAAFEGCTRDDVCMRVTFYLEELEGYTLGVSILATAAKAMLPEIWRKVGEHPFRMTTEAFAAVLLLVAEELRKHLEVQLVPFGVMTRASAASVSAQAPPDSEATVSSSVAIKLTKGLRWLQKKVAEQGKEIAELKEALARLSA